MHMKGHKRWLAAVMACLLACQGAAFAAEDSGAEELWRRLEPGGDYVTIRVDASAGEELPYGERRCLAVRYADTKEPVALTSEYLDGYLFATRTGLWRCSRGRSRCGRTWSSILPDRGPTTSASGA